MSDTIIARFHGALVEALRQRDPEHLSRPFTVAEIYQDLVPYGAYRDVLGVEMNGDYEHALLRLLAGESDFLEMESEHALREIQEELQSVNPNTGLYREFAAVDVRLNPAHIPDPADVEVHVPGAEEESDGSGWPPATEGDPVSDRDYIQVVPLGAFAASGPLDPEMVDDEPASAEPVETASPMSAYATEAELNPEPEEPSVSSQAVEADNCRWCRETLPRRENLNFCPFCGTDVKLVPCISCGEAIEPEWRFCIACGARSPEE
jgi:hypothetical protein